MSDNRKPVNTVFCLCNQLSPGRATGSSLIELVVLLPLLLIITLGIVQLALVYEAKNNLNYAVFMAARSGAMKHASKKSLVSGLVKSLIPIYSPARSTKGLMAAETKALNDVSKYASIKILNPTREAFRDFSVINPVTHQAEIPNEMLHQASTVKGPGSGINIQDANLLKIRVLYGYKLQVPFVNKLITTLASSLTTDKEKRYLLLNGRLPIQATATVRMQSTAWMNDWVTSRKQ